MSRKIMTNRQADSAARLRIRGKSLSALAKRYGVSKTTVARRTDDYLAAIGKKEITKRITPAEAYEMAIMREAGMSLSQIAKKCRVSRAVVLKTERRTASGTPSQQIFSNRAEPNPVPIRRTEIIEKVRRFLHLG